MSTPIKSCLFCEHIHWKEGYDLSEVTYEGAQLQCLLGHWITYPSEDRLIPDLRVYVLKAEECLDYKPCQ